MLATRTAEACPARQVTAQLAQQPRERSRTVDQAQMIPKRVSRERCLLPREVLAKHLARVYTILDVQFLDLSAVGTS